ncbi:hypothetical protein [Microbacterium sp.]|uniref:hypothetical protein n=1 Tax=Microbacterium sp. TaxID=51671 RepID=UPI0039E5F3A0
MRLEAGAHLWDAAEAAKNIDYEIVWGAVTNRVPELSIVLDDLVTEALRSIEE